MSISEDAKARRLAGLHKASLRGVEQRAGWPTMHGTDEERDEEFRRQVVAEAYRLGLLPKRRAA